MKKITTTFLLIISIIGGLFALSSCREKSLVNNEKTQNMIKEDLIDFLFSDEENITTEDIILEQYLGIYNNVFVAKYISRYFVGFEYDEKIEGFHFEDPRISPILVWKNHEFYTLKDAYEKDYLSLENIETIYNMYIEKNQNLDSSENIGSNVYVQLAASLNDSDYASGKQWEL